MNDYFCVVPFYCVDILPNLIQECCLLPKNTNIETVKNEMLLGRRPNECSACWKLEDNKLISDRQIKNNALDYYLDRDIAFIENDAKLGKNKPLVVKVQTSNKCNATCVTCNKNSSSSWGSLLFRQSRESIVRQSVSINELDKNIDYKNIVMLNLLGGEPLFEDRNFYILQKLLDSHNTNCFITVSTNGSVKLTKKQETLLSQFKNLNFCVSIDGIDAVFEYTRFPIKWKDLVDSVAYFKELGHVSASFTISNLNIFYYNETVKWFKENNINYNHNLVYYPHFLSISALPLEVKTYLLNINNHELFSSLIKDHLPIHDEMFKEFVSSIQYQDNLKGINFSNYLPEFYKIIKPFM